MALLIDLLVVIFAVALFTGDAIFSNRYDKKVKEDINKRKEENNLFLSRYGEIDCPPGSGKLEKQANEELLYNGSVSRKYELEVKKLFPSRGEYEIYPEALDMYFAEEYGKLTYRGITRGYDNLFIMGWIAHHIQGGMDRGVFWTIVDRKKTYYWENSGAFTTISHESDFELLKSQGKPDIECGNIPLSELLNWW